MTLPKFTSETTYQLNDVLKTLGMPTALDLRPEGGADFRGLTDSEDLIGFYISSLIHKAKIEVNEKGTEAIAGLAMVARVKGMSNDVDFVPKVRADHPFIFMIRHRESNSVLFMGRMMNPTEADLHVF